MYLLYELIYDMKMEECHWFKNKVWIMYEGMSCDHSQWSRMWIG